MISKEEIEKAKEELNNYIIIINKTKDTENEWHGYYNNELHELKRDIQTLLQYIDQLEQENSKLNKINNEMAKEMYLNINILEMAKIGKAINYDPRKMFAGISDEEGIDCIKQYFEKKVEEK